MCNFDLDTALLNTELVCRPARLGLPCGKTKGRAPCRLWEELTDGLPGSVAVVCSGSPGSLLLVQWEKWFTILQKTALRYSNFFIVILIIGY